jgi:long-chain-fatty-acid--CoA ligase ACSBG
MMNFFDGFQLIASASGYLKITGRLKELIITKGGENVAPLLIEQVRQRRLKL